MKSTFIFILIFLLCVILTLRCHKKADPLCPQFYLTTIAYAQSHFQDQRVIDQDQNGIGEFGSFQNLYEISFRNPTIKTEFHFLRKDLPGLAINNGIVEYKGYYFIMYLPKYNGKPYNGEELPSCNANDAKYQEKSWICYAWPSEDRDHDLRCLVISQDSNVYVFANRNKRYIGMKRKPNPWSALDIDSPSLRHLNGKIGINHNSTDGEDWELLLPG